MDASKPRQISGGATSLEEFGEEHVAERVIPASSPNVLADQYDEEYYLHHLGPDPYDRNNASVMNLFAVVADEVIRSLHPKSVLDVGCAMGFLVEALWDRGVKAWGTDVSRYAISNVRKDIQPFCCVASATDPIDCQYDLITCIEVLEHLPPEDSEAAIENMCRATDTILFSSSPYDITEPTHINVRQPISWLELFAKTGFAPDLMYDAGFLTPQAMLLRRTSQPMNWDVLRLCSEMARHKYAVVQRDSRIRQLTETILQKECEANAVQQQLAGLRRQNTVSEVAVGTGPPRALDSGGGEEAARTTQITHFTANLQQSSDRCGRLEVQTDMLATEATALRSETVKQIADMKCAAAAYEKELAGIREELQNSGLSREVIGQIETRIGRLEDTVASLSARMYVNLEAMAAERDEIRSKNNVEVVRLQADAAAVQQELLIEQGRTAELREHISAIEKEIRDLRDAAATADLRLKRIDESFESVRFEAADTRKQVRGVLESRIWRTLKWMGGLVLRSRPTDET